MRTAPEPVITAFLLAAGTFAQVMAEDHDHSGWDHYIQVDVGQKKYDVVLYRTGDEHLKGDFDDSIVVSPTACIRSMDKNSNFGWVLTAGLDYGHFSDERVTADVLECHLGLGATAHLTDWAFLNLMFSGGVGWTDVALPPGYRTWDDLDTAWGTSGHVEAVATLGLHYHGVLLTANAGYRYTSMVLSDPENADRHDDYAIHGFVVGAGIGFTF